MGSDPRSTVGTATDANAMLRILFSRVGTPHIGPPSAFSFNTATEGARPQGAVQPLCVRREPVGGVSWSSRT
jgi:hypothetical protein